MKKIHVEMEVDEWGNITYRDHTADTCRQTDRCTPMGVGLAVAWFVLGCMGALSPDADKSI